jgi:Mg-chelatase subunit ChlD
MTDELRRERWRLVLGRHSYEAISACAHGHCGRRETVLDELYGAVYARRGVRPGEPGAEGDARDDTTENDSEIPRGSEGSAPTGVHWLSEARALFPTSTVETMERDALQRFGLSELVSAPDVLKQLTPSQALVATLMTRRGRLAPEVLVEARRIIREVVEELTLRLRHDVARALVGRTSLHRHTPVASAAAFDPRGTLNASLRHWDPAQRRFAWIEPKFFERNTPRLPWEVVLLVDQSASMSSSVIHSAVTAGILAAVPQLRVRLVVFDTSVVDLTDEIDDPVEVLLSVQLGGGTDIASAVRYADEVIQDPARTAVVLISDFAEGGEVTDLVASVRRLAERRVTLLGLAALDENAAPWFDHQVAGRLSDEGMPVAALTPDQLARWLGEVTAR